MSIISLNDNISAIVGDAAQEILQYTPQLFCRPEDGPLNPKAIASGILINVGKSNFLVTAAHVLKEFRPEDIGIMIKQQFYILNGEVKYTDTSLSGINEKVDLAVWKLHKNVADDITNFYRFLNLAQIGNRHIVDTKPHYLVVGFPVSQTKRNPRERTIEPDPFVYLTKTAEQKYYDKLAFDSQQNILVYYQKSKVKIFSSKTQKIHHGPKPVGVSGGGLWYLPSFLVEKGKKVPLILIGIMTEHHGRFNILAATKVALVTDIIRNHFKERI